MGAGGGSRQHLEETALLTKRRDGISGRGNHSMCVDDGDNMVPWSYGTTLQELVLESPPEF